MHIKPISAVVGGDFVYAAKHEGSSATLTVSQPGVVHVSVTPDQQILVKHTSMYVDFVFNVHADRLLHATRAHVAWRHGDQREAVDEPTDVATRTIVLSMVKALVEEYPLEVGRVPDPHPDEVQSRMAAHAAAIRDVEDRLAKVEADEKKLAITRSQLQQMLGIQQLQLVATRNGGRGAPAADAMIPAPLGADVEPLAFTQLADSHMNDQDHVGFESWPPAADFPSSFNRNGEQCVFVCLRLLSSRVWEIQVLGGAGVVFRREFHEAGPARNVFDALSLYVTAEALETFGFVQD